MTVNYKWIGLSALGSAAVWMYLAATGLTDEQAVTGGLTVLVAMLWITEALPIGLTALIPFVAFPMAGVMTYNQAASALGSHVILLLI